MRARGPGLAPPSLLKGGAVAIVPVLALQIVRLAAHTRQNSYIMQQGAYALAPRCGARAATHVCLPAN